MTNTKINYNIINDKGETVVEESINIPTSTALKPISTASTFDLPTGVADKAVNTFNNLSTVDKVLAVSGAGLALVILAGVCISICCYISRFRRRRRQHGEVQVSYPLGPISPGLRRRR